jgi:CRISPR-associated protein Cas5t
MVGLYVSVPVASFRKGLAREYLETEELPAPATCYGFLLSLVGETDRTRHVGCRVTAALIQQPERSVVLRTIWRIKNRNLPMGDGNNRMPAQQEILTGVRVVIWLASDEEQRKDISLEERTLEALSRPECVDRFGGLSLGESSHLVDEIKLFESDSTRRAAMFLLADHGQLTLPVWVDHVGSKDTTYVTGDLIELPLVAPGLTRVPKIEPSI